MDKATVGGVVMAFGLLALAVMLAPGGNFMAFWDAASASVVIGGALAAICIAFPLGALFLIPKVVKKVLMPGTKDLKPVIKQLVQFSEIARRDGILALESKTDEIDDPFILLGIQMAVDGTDAELMEAVLRTEMEAISARHKVGKSLMETGGRYAPAFGMIGTLMGLIIMLGNMDDPAAIGPGMAVALITTLYGAMVSNIIFLPFADKLGYYTKKEMEIREVIVRGILSIQDGDNPRMLEQKLNMFLPQSQRDSEEDEAA